MRIDNYPTFQTSLRSNDENMLCGFDIEALDKRGTTNVRDYRLSAGQKIVKRFFDILISLAGFVIFLPIIILIALVIWLDDYHNPIFSQKRVGLGGKVFTIYKFRSMRIDSESDGVPRLCEENDSRLTRVGAFLRNHHLDEFPQLWNVLKGDMSVVGPRPERPYFTKKSWKSIPTIVCFSPCARGCSLRPHYTTATPTPSGRWSGVPRWTLIISRTIRWLSI